MIRNDPIAQKLLELYFVPGSFYHQGSVNVPKKYYPLKKRVITIDKILAHIAGDVSLLAPAVHENLVKWVTVDIDTDELEKIRIAKTALANQQLPAYVSFSGSKGYHIEIFFDIPVPLALGQRLAAQVKNILDAVAVKYDTITPSANGKGGGSIKVPLGVHPETGLPCYYLDDNLREVTDPLNFLMAIKSYSVKLDESTTSIAEPRIDKNTGEIIEPPLLDKISSRPCVNKLWRDGLQANGTRHSATCVIANAIIRNPLIAQPRKRDAVCDWVNRTFLNSKDKGFTATDLAIELKEALRLYDNYGKFTRVEHCENAVFKTAMRSACDSEFACKLEQNNGYVNWTLFSRLSIFNAHNANPPGLGKVAQSIYYCAMSAVAHDYRRFIWNGLPAFALGTQQSMELANCSQVSVIKHRKKLLAVGLIIKVPQKEIPPDIWADIPYNLKQHVYALADISDEATVKEILRKLRAL